MQLKTLFCSFLFLALTACSTTNDYKVMAVDSEKLLYNDAFPSHTEYTIETPEQIYALNDEMKKFIRSHLMYEKDPHARSRKLLKKLFHRSPDSIRYQNGANLTAIQAFNENTANCLSLTILAYALADEANLMVNFQEVLIPEYWIREGDYNMLTGHVNLKVVGDKTTPYKVVWGSLQTTIDFDPYTVKKHFPKNKISKDRVTAMFYNNKGAQALVRNKYNLAYAYFKKSIEQEGSFSSVWGNLGLLYKKVGLNNYAEQAYLAAVNFNRDNYNAWNNLAILENEMGKFDEARKIYGFIHKARMNNPYYHALLGDEAFFNEEYKLAIRHYKKAKSMQPKEHEFYFGLSKSFFKLGNYDLSEHYLSKAKRYAPFKDIKDKYQNKLNLLSSL
ncbi:tetratricopeptide repeat protein [Thalassotalea sp. ND16A]|uniref:tetratricopeptide repeat protein n=1 Tax=Thalassotalea sp. ND16A TaxID=1535422 RepID=UPI00051E0AB7|nr:tetratricopeptide repeat protein [Thalassotalea sp. ND16A]KGJ96039.1 hypothetical protein ND16A_1098 [Thalassotalea sp. ND16A]